MVTIKTTTYYNGTSYKVGDECKENSATQKRWIANGIAEQSDADLFDEPEQSKFTAMTDEQLSEYAETVGVDISRVRSREAAIAKIEKAEHGE